VWQIHSQMQGSSSRFIGVSASRGMTDGGNSAWRAVLYDQLVNQNIGCFASEEDAARAYDCAAAGGVKCGRSTARYGGGSQRARLAATVWPQIAK
jgi:hypothetical protein